MGAVYSAGEGRSGKSHAALDPGWSKMVWTLVQMARLGHFGVLCSSLSAPAPGSPSMAPGWDVT